MVPTRKDRLGNSSWVSDEFFRHSKLSTKHMSTLHKIGRTPYLHLPDLDEDASLYCCVQNL